MGIYLIEEKLMLQFKMYYLKPILFIAQKAEKESFLDGDSRENDKAMALAKRLLVKIAIQMFLWIFLSTYIKMNRFRSITNIEMTGHYMVNIRSF